ncbi:MAG: OmpA family protein [Bacteroidaceae bacterium]|nr:OmpA family protein [Bacteroidaceae bacterium]
MKKSKIGIVALCGAMLLSSCGMSNTAKGGLIGGGGGAAAGALIGALIGNGKGAAIGAGIGAAVGAGAGVLIGNKMDKAKKAAEAIAGAEAEALKDAEGLTYVKVTFDSGILFTSGQSVLTQTAKNSLTQFATNVLTPDMDLAIVGYTDNDPWKGSTAEQSKQKNLVLSEQRAQSVSTFIISAGATTNQVKYVLGKGEENPVASNATAAGKAENRRVEVYILPSKEMIQSANAGTLK